MKNRRLSEAMNHLDDELIASAMDESDISGENAHLKRRKGMKLNTLWKKAAAAVAMLAIIVSVGFIVAGLAGMGSAGAVVALDVNPSIEIEVNAKEIVTDVDGVNADAESLLRGMQLEGKPLEEALNQIVDALIAGGYISTDKNSILISVDSKNQKTVAALKEKLTGELGTLLGGNNIDAAVLTQEFEHGEEIGKLAEQYGISYAKTTLIAKIVASGLLDANGVPYTFEALASNNININDLKLILDSKEFAVEGVSGQGSASIGSYITRDEAIAAALLSRGLSASDISALELEIDYDHRLGIMVYEIEFIYGENAYEYEINATNGAVLEEEIEPAERDEAEAPVIPPESVKARNEALAIAYAHAKVSAEAIIRPHIELDFEDGVYVYEIEFKTAEYEYEYEINALTGAIISFELEPND